MKLRTLITLTLAAASALLAADPVKLLNVPCDPTRELYQDINAALAKQWKAKTGVDVQIAQSHDGSESAWVGSDPVRRRKDQPYPG